MATRDDLLERALALDDDAARLPEGDDRAFDLRQHSAKLRVQALGTRPYPVLVCNVCSQLTGWVGADGACATDIRRRQETADTGHLGMPDRRIRAAAENVSLLRRVKRGLGVGTSHDRIREWLTKVDPDETGPVVPEDGWALEWPVNVELSAPEGPHLLVVFDAQSFCFEYGAWRECATTPGGKPRRLVPREFSASLSMDALAEAWNDFKLEVEEHNALVWGTEQKRRAGLGQAEQERLAAFEIERGTSRLLE